MNVPETKTEKVAEKLDAAVAVVEAAQPGVLIAVLIDKSGSMVSCREATIDGFNVFIAEQKLLPGRAWLTLTMFNTSVDVRFVAADIKTVQSLTPKTYIPDGGTALLDAIGITIQRTLDWIDDQSEKPGRVVFVISTDGGENSSHDFSGEDIKKLIDRQNEEGWEIVYLGANQDAIAVGTSLGVRQQKSIRYAATRAGTGNLYAAVSSNITQVRSDVAHAVMDSTVDWTNAGSEENDR